MTGLTDEMIAAGWLPHDGGPCPVPLDSRPGVMFRDGEIVPPGEFTAGPWRWDRPLKSVARRESRDIIAYRPETPDA